MWFIETSAQQSELMLSPELRINRIVVEGALGLDLRLNPGLNVVYAAPVTESAVSPLHENSDEARYTNKAGKTGLVELIQHGLGVRQESRENFHFAPIATKLRTLWMEVESNGEVMTLERSLREMGARLTLRDRPYAKGISSSPGETVAVEEISSVMLQRLRIPEVMAPKGEKDVEPLSFPNLMRGFILHQRDSFGALIDKMPPMRRTHIIGFLTGIIPEAFFRRAAVVGEIRSRADTLRSRYDAVIRFLESNGIPDVMVATEQVEETERAVEASRARRAALQDRMRAGENASEDFRGRLEQLRAELLQVGSRRSELERSRAALIRDSERLTALSASLRADLTKARRLQTSVMILSTVDFQDCPRCLLAVTPEMRQREDHSRCALCNRPLRNHSDASPRFLARTADIALQVDEAERVLRDIRVEIGRTDESLVEMRDKEGVLGVEIEAQSRSFVSPLLDQFVQASAEVAAAETNWVSARRALENRTAAERIREQWEAALNEIQELEDKIEGARGRARARRSRLRELYQEILHAVRFPDLKSVSIDAKTLMPNINGNLYRHSGVAFTGLAVTCYHLAMLRLSLEEETFFPRLLVIDSPAVGDLNDRNHDDLLNYLATFQKESVDEAGRRGGDPVDLPWQIILTTRRMTQALEPNTVLTISNHENERLLTPRTIRYRR